MNIKYAKKFTNPREMERAYLHLQAAFTRKCQEAKAWKEQALGDGEGSLQEDLPSDFLINQENLFDGALSESRRVDEPSQINLKELLEKNAEMLEKGKGQSDSPANNEDKQMTPEDLLAANAQMIKKGNKMAESPQDKTAFFTDEMIDELTAAINSRLDWLNADPDENEDLELPDLEPPAISPQHDRDKSNDLQERTASMDTMQTGTVDDPAIIFLTAQAVNQKNNETLPQKPIEPQQDGMNPAAEEEPPRPGQLPQEDLLPDTRQSRRGEPMPPPKDERLRQEPDEEMASPQQRLSQLLQQHPELAAALQTKAVMDYLQALTREGAPAVVPGRGSPVSSPARPKNLDEAGRLAQKLFG